MTWITLDKCDGPNCPRCGCNDTEKREFGVRWGQASVKWICNHCGKTFPVQERSVQPLESSNNGHHVIEQTGPAPIIYPVMRCPVGRGGCGSTNTKVTSTRRLFRYHKCKDCDFNFKSPK